MKRVPTLDGWRGIAILLVLVTHYQEAFVQHPFARFRWMDLGKHGVTIFLVLSGYLITSRLLEEKKINLRHFYLRRSLRLMPNAWTYLLFIGALSLVTRAQIVGRDALACVFFFRNYYSVVQTSANTLTGHFWSLSLEEQFYLVWPPLLALAGRRWGLGLAAAGAAACAAFRFFHWSQYDGAPISVHSEVRADALFVGCALALLLEYDSIRAWFAQHGKKIFWICVAPLVMEIYLYRDLIPLTESMLIAAMIASTSLSPTQLPATVLEWQHLKLTGMISYSIYVWQGVFLRPHWGHFGFLLLGASALGSWMFIEQPCIRLGRALLRDHRWPGRRRK